MMSKLTFSDYGQIHSFNYNPAVNKLYQPFSENDIKQISNIISNSKKLTLSGGSHTFNGSSLPSDGAYHIDFSRFRWLKFIDSTTIEVASGVTVWDLRDYLAKSGLDLKVWNGGAAGPTVGGYIMAGGFGRSGLSEQDGGFWEIVKYLRVCIPATGEILRIDRDHKLFKWLFGSAGTLAIVLSAGINVLPGNSLLTQELSTKSVPYFQNIVYNRHRFPTLFSYMPLLKQESEFILQDSKLFWFSILAYPEEHASSLLILSKFCNEFSDFMSPIGGWLDLPDNALISPAYHYIIEHKTFIPPLLMNQNRTFFVNGIMAYLPNKDKNDHNMVKKVSTYFTNLVLGSGLRLYHQAEDFFSLIDFNSYYDETTWQEYQDLKNNLDPNSKLHSLT